MPQNQFLPFATGAGANTLAPAVYAAQGYLAQGFQAGIAQPYDINTALRQLSTVVSALGQFTANNQTADVLDDGVVTNFVTKFTAALQGALASETVHYGDATGTNDALVVTATPPLVPTTTGSYQPGSFLVFKTIAGPANQTTAPTINANSIGNIAITKRGGAPLAPGDLAGSAWYVAFFDGIGCYLLAPTLSDLGVPATALWHTGVDTSASAATIIATANPPVPTRIADLAYLVFPANACAGATQINVGFGLEPLTRNDTTPLQAGDYIAGQPLVVVDDGTRLRIVNLTLPQILSNIVSTNTFPQILSNPIVYVRTDGSDTNTGSANTPAGAFATIAGAVSYITKYFVTTGQVITIQLGIPGTYVAPPSVSNGNFIIQGDPANQGNYILTGAGNPSIGQPVIGFAQANVQLVGLTLQNAGNGASTLGAGSTATISCSNVTFTLTGSNCQYHILAGPGASVIVNGGCTFSGSAVALWVASGGNVELGQVNTSVLGSPTFSHSTVWAFAGGQIQISSGASFSGTATGSKFNATLNGIINTSGAGINFFPGSSAGTLGTGGQYV